MEEKFFLVQTQRKNGEYTKGVAVKDTLDAARVLDSIVDDRIPRPEPEE